MTGANAHGERPEHGQRRPGPFAPYRAVLGARFRMLLQYRVAAIAGTFTQLAFGLVLIMIYEAFSGSVAPEARPMTFPQVASYVWLGQALFAMMPWNVDREVAALVRSGAVANELCRPIDLYRLWFTRALAARTAPTALRGVPVALVAGLGLPLLGLSGWRLAPPPSLAAAAGFVAALGCALALSCAITALASVTMLWTIGGEGTAAILTTAVPLFSGLIIPLPMMPEWLQRILHWLPFTGLLDLPTRIYSGHLAPGDLASVLARQLGWTIALFVLGRWLLACGMRRLVVQGG